MIFAPYDASLARRQSENRPIKVGLIGAGNLARMIALQLVGPPPPGIKLVAVANRTATRAAEMIRQVGGEAVEIRSSALPGEVQREGIVGFTDDWSFLTRSERIDVIVDATGTVDYSLQIVLDAFAHGKHVVLANAELDSTLGPLLKKRADQAGVVYTNIDGDEPGVAMNLIRYARSLGLRVVAAGNLKGMIDPYRNPQTQEKFAREHGQNPAIVTSFADGTKLSMELAILANATGFKVGKPGMYGPACKHVKEIAQLLPAEQLRTHGLVDYALGAEPYTGAFAVVWEENPSRQRWLRYLKMGDGPFYTLYTPYHLPHIQAISTIGRAVDTKDATVAPLDSPVCHVASYAKKDLAAGTVLDGPGGFTCYGQIENFSPAPVDETPLPIALSTECVLRRNIAKDQRITCADVTLNSASPAVNLWTGMVDSVRFKRNLI